MFHISRTSVKNINEKENRIYLNKEEQQIARRYIKRSQYEQLLTNKTVTGSRPLLDLELQYDENFTDAGQHLAVSWITA